MVIDVRYLHYFWEIHENVDLVLLIQNIFELEGIINTRECVSFLSRSIPFFPKEQVILKPREGTEYIGAKTQVCEKFSFFGCRIISLETVIFNPKKMLGIWI